MQRHTTIAVIAVIATSLAGCDMLGEEIAERAAEQVTGADIDVDDEGISVESSEGSFSADEGGFQMETDDGTFETQTGQVPEGFPDEVPLPDATVINGSRMDGADGMAWMVNFQYDSGQPREVLDAQVAALEDAGFSAGEGGASFNVDDGSGGGMAGAMMENDQYTVNLSVLGEPDDFVLGYQVFDKQDEDAADGS